MGRRLRSLRFRLLLVIIIVLAVNAAAATVLASRVITQRFEQYVVYGEAASQQRRQSLQMTLPPLLHSFYAQEGSWERAGSILSEMGEMSGERILLVDETGRVLVDSAGDLVGQGVPPWAAELGQPIQDLASNGRVVGTFIVAPIEVEEDNSNEATYIAQVNRALLSAVVGTGLLAVVLILAMTRRVLKPVEALTIAAQRMEEGDLQQRVEVSSNDEIGELARAFNAMADSLSQAEALRRNMVSDVAHELRTPLSNIRGYLEAVQDGVVAPSPEMIGSLHEEAMLLYRLVEDLQELALAEAGHLRLFRQNISMREVVERVVYAIDHPGNGNGLSTEIDVPPSLPDLYADPERLGQVMRNLIVNAQTHAERGGCVRIRALADDHSLLVGVYNSGRPIPQDQIPFLFERFYRADRSRARTTGGSGLGLAIVKQLVESHGGQVWVENQGHEGVEFLFRLPLHSNGEIPH